jgi:hypothetical protein
MSEQYAFAIGFDVESDEADQLPDDHWKGLYEQIGRAIRESGLPSIDSERWDEFGQGRIFWGTKAECDAARRVLEPFDVYVEEARNLDPGYYATPSHTYYVSDTGLISLLPSDWDAAPLQPLETVDCIPLDSYRLKVVDPEFHATCQALLRIESIPEFEGDRLEPDESDESDEPDESNESDESAELRDRIATLSLELETYQANHSTQVTQEVYANLEDRYAQQTARVTDLEAQVAHLQHEVDAKNDPQGHEALQTELAQLTVQLSALTARAEIERRDHETLQQTLSQQNLRETALELKLKEAEAQINQWKQQAEAAIQPEAHASLQQQLEEQTAQIQDLQALTKSLQQQLQEATDLAAHRIDPSRYEAIEQDVADKAKLVENLRRMVQLLEREAHEWQTVANAKVEWSQHQALQEELQQLKMRQRKGLFSRLFG